MADIVDSHLTGGALKYKYDCKIAGNVSTNAENQIELEVNYSIQAVDKITGQPCPLRPYVADQTVIVILPNVENDINIDIDNHNIARVTVSP